MDDGLDRQDDTWGSRLARLVVEQVFFGLHDEKEIEIDPGITTVCYFRMRKGQLYFIYAKRNADGGFRTSSCLGSVRLDLALEDLQFARRVARGDAAPSLRKYRSGRRGNRRIGARKTLPGDNRRRGNFKIAPVTPGKYELQAAIAGYVTDEAVYSGEVATRGCAEINIILRTDGRISGTCTTPRALPRRRSKRSSRKWIRMAISVPCRR